ncbi:zinc ion binding [Paramecium bursaria]
MIKSRLYEFITPNISDILNCSICRQVFHKPQRIICGNKTNILHQGKDLIAQKFIEELMVKCKKCKWEGKRGSFQQHLKECQSRRSNIIQHSIKKSQIKEQKFASKSVTDLNQHYLESAHIDKDGNIEVFYSKLIFFYYQVDFQGKLNPRLLDRDRDWRRLNTNLFLFRRK